jgi:tight adherence protein B
MPVAVATAMALAVAAAWLAVQGPQAGISRAGLSADAGSYLAGASANRRLLMTLAAGCVGWLAPDSHRLALLLVGVLTAAVVARRQVRAANRRRLRRERQRAVIDLCDALTAELHAGTPADAALERSSALWPEWTPVTSAVNLGGDAGPALLAAAARPGAEGLRYVAAAWEVAGRSGAGLTAVLDRVVSGLRADEEARAEVHASLGPPRATARLLAVLPVFGLGLGYGMGAHPLAFLLNSTVGAGCLLTGCTLALLGLWWVERIAEAVER